MKVSKSMDLARRMRAAAISASDGHWRIGNGYGSIVSTEPVSGRRTSQSEVEVYGGHLVCESVANASDAAFLALCQPIAVIAIVDEMEAMAERLRGIERDIQLMAENARMPSSEG
jgi:hypothetical protein